MVGLYDLESGPVIVDRVAADPNGIWACLFWWEYEGAISVLEDFFPTQCWESSIVGQISEGLDCC